MTASRNFFWGGGIYYFYGKNSAIIFVVSCVSISCHDFCFSSSSFHGSLRRVEASTHPLVSPITRVRDKEGNCAFLNVLHVMIKSLSPSLSLSLFSCLTVAVPLILLLQYYLYLIFQFLLPLHLHSLSAYCAKRKSL